MDIAIVTTFYSSVGGVSSYVKNIKKSLYKRKIPAFIFSPDVDNEELSNNIIHLRSKYRLILSFETFGALYKNKIRDVHCHGVWYLLLGCIIYKLVSRLFNIKINLITIKHSDIQLNKTFTKRKIFQFLDNRTNGVVYVSNYLKEKYFDDFNFRINIPKYIITPGCAFPVYESQVIDKIKDFISYQEYKPILTYTGLFEYKGKVEGICLLLECIADLIEFFPYILLVIAGKGSLEGLIKEKIKLYGLKKNVKILNNITNNFNILKLSDLHCHISYQDNFPITILEALSTGTPVVASPVGEIANLNIEGLIKTYSWRRSEIVEVIKSCLNRKIIVDVANVMNRFSWDKSTSLLLGIHQGFNAQNH